MKKLILAIVLFIPLVILADIVELKDGRMVDLRSDGTYEFLESGKASGLVFSLSQKHDSYYMDTKKDAFGKEKIRAFIGCWFDVTVENNLDFPIVLDTFRLSTNVKLGDGWQTSVSYSGNDEPIHPKGTQFYSGEWMRFLTIQDSIVVDKMPSSSEKIGLIRKYGCQKFKGSRLSVVLKEIEYLVPDGTPPINLEKTVSVRSSDFLDFTVR
jgi:hypothetical protein